MKWILPLIVLSSVSCSARAPSIHPDYLPEFDAAYACSIDVYPRTPVPDGIVLARDCVPIDAEAFRQLVLLAEPEAATMWKSGFLVLARSQRSGDRYFILSFTPGVFTRPGPEGAYFLPKSARAQWEEVTYSPLNRGSGRRWRFRVLRCRFGAHELPTSRCSDAADRQRWAHLAAGGRLAP